MVFNPAWILNKANEPHARDRLGDIVGLLTYQRRRQQFFENGCAGLFWGTALATAAVAAARMADPAANVVAVAAPIVAIALAAVLVRTWIDRPDKLQVAIQADIQLKLKQRLSTAWEFTERDADPALAQRLAVQAVNQRYPTRHQPVFPLRYTVWARLWPLAALLLILVSLLDLPRATVQPAQSVDDVVVSEGARLREFARHMQVRAERANLPRSNTESERMRRLGARMESGSISREQALQRLQSLGKGLSGQRRAALADAGVPGVHAPAAAGSGDGDAGRLRDLLEQLLQGRVTPGELDLSAADSSALAALGITSDELRKALADFAAGEPRELREMVSELSRVEIATEDAHELGRASERIALVRENLGDQQARNERFAASGYSEQFEAGDDDPRMADAMMRRFNRGYGLDMPADLGSGAGSGLSERQAAQALSRGSAGADVAMRPDAQQRGGSSFASQARVLPNAGPAGVASVQVDSRFTAQIEEAFAKEHYPPHHKAFIRRYFLTLSQGEAGAPRIGQESP